MTPIARLKITLRDVKPKVLRRIEVPVDLRLDRLHQVLQAALGWTDSHLHEFRAGNSAWGRPDPDDLYEGPLPETKARLQDILDAAGGKTFRYIYDFGDNWEHDVRVEHLGEAELGATYPRLLAAEGRCPPEDVGGPWGYAEFLEALADPDHEQHEELLDWYGGPFDPQDAETDRLAREVARPAKHWAPKPRKPRAASKSIN